MDHIGCIAPELVYFGTDDDVIFFSPAKQPLQPFPFVSSPGHHVGKNPVFTHTGIFQFRHPERQLLVTG